MFLEKMTETLNDTNSSFSLSKTNIAAIIARINKSDEVQISGIHSADKLFVTISNNIDQQSKNLSAYIVLPNKVFAENEIVSSILCFTEKENCF